MAIEFTYLNGKSSFFDVDKFESDFKNHLKDTCEDAKVYIFNNFPVTITHNIRIDAILIIALKELRGNFFRVLKKEGHSYIKNLIIPISFVNTYKSDKINLVDNVLQTREADLDYEAETSALKFRLSDYLSKKCGFEKKGLTIIPMIHISNQLKAVSGNCLSYPEFTFEAFNFFLTNSSDTFFISYKKWKESSYYSNIYQDISQITEQASLDAEYGFLTKKKLERLRRKLSQSSNIQSNLNKSLIEIHGKSGTGKSTELLTLFIRNILKGNNAKFLTYNKLLVFDHATSVNTFFRKYDIDQSNPLIGEYSIDTLHHFFYHLSTNLGVLHVMSEERIIKLKNLINKRLRTITDYLDTKNKYLLSEPDKLIQEFQNHRGLDKGTIELAIDLIKYSERSKILLVHNKIKCIKKFKKFKCTQLTNFATRNIFLSDYYGVLKETIDQIQNPEDYFNKNDIKDKYDLLEKVLKLKDKHLDANKKIDKRAFIEKKNRKIGGFRRKRTLFIDEAQDCHYLEKDIIVEIFGAKNIVVATGGAEQLIRHVELCNWDYSQGSNLNSVKFNTPNQSYRVKKAILTFCEFIAKRYNIRLELEPYKEGQIEPEDVGQIIFDFRKNIGLEQLSSIIGILNARGQVHGCSNLESVLVLLETVGFIGEANVDLVINEFDNIIINPNLLRDKWEFLKSDLAEDQSFWDGTVKDKRELAIPTPSEKRVIFYESCRGIESWAVLCMHLDTFFDKRFDDPEAEKFLIGNEIEMLTKDVLLSNIDRKKMFAATWALMAATRAIDTLYINIKDKGSEIGTAIADFYKEHSANVRIIEDE